MVSVRYIGRFEDSISARRPMNSAVGDPDIASEFGAGDLTSRRATTIIAADRRAVRSHGLLSFGTPGKKIREMQKIISVKL